MAKLIEELVVIKLTKMVKDSNADGVVLDDSQKEVLLGTLPALVEEVLADGSIVVELADIG